MTFSHDTEQSASTTQSPNAELLARVQAELERQNEELGVSLGFLQELGNCELSVDATTVEDITELDQSFEAAPSHLAQTPVGGAVVRC